MRIDNENKVVWCSEQLIDWKNSFRRLDNPAMSMMHSISRVGYGWNLTDAAGNVIGFEFWDVKQKKGLC